MCAQILFLSSSGFSEVLPVPYGPIFRSIPSGKKSFCPPSMSRSSPFLHPFSSSAVPAPESRNFSWSISSLLLLLTRALPWIQVKVHSIPVDCDPSDSFAHLVSLIVRLFPAVLLSAQIATLLFKLCNAARSSIIMQLALAFDVQKNVACSETFNFAVISLSLYSYCYHAVIPQDFRSLRYVMRPVNEWVDFTGVTMYLALCLARVDRSLTLEYGRSKVCRAHWNLHSVDSE